MNFINPSLRQIEAFVWTCSLGSITAAAERMSLTQSAVSVLIRQLELGMGAKLLDRTTRALHPTAAGREVLTDADRTIERVLLELEAANAFVMPVDAARTWFRYHHMFADLLQLELRRTAPGEVTALHRVAARWFARTTTDSITSCMILL